MLLLICVFRTLLAPQSGPDPAPPWPLTALHTTHTQSHKYRSDGKTQAQKTSSRPKALPLEITKRVGLMQRFTVQAEGRDSMVKPRYRFVRCIGYISAPTDIEGADQANEPAKHSASISLLHTSFQRSLASALVPVPNISYRPASTFTVVSIKSSQESEAMKVWGRRRGESGSNYFHVKTTTSLLAIAGLQIPFVSQQMGF